MRSLVHPRKLYIDVQASALRGIVKIISHRYCPIIIRYYMSLVTVQLFHNGNPT